jgi:uncharacterized membrane-anchored protein YhcB (DUF1043 family)
MRQLNASRFKKEADKIETLAENDLKFYQHLPTSEGPARLNEEQTKKHAPSIMLIAIDIFP